MGFEDVSKIVYKTKANILLQEYKDKCKEIYPSFKKRDEYDRKCMSLWKLKYRKKYADYIEKSI